MYSDINTDEYGWWCIFKEWLTLYMLSEFPATLLCLGQKQEEQLGK